ncbi:FAD/NAD-P-binding domain-containing protein [Dendrothele bispora CBS 962.96]|uniref:FAD/NAD-P-binding domain-containing protein n=1 Tax=Dendrothele bispora (strain CBS 962.96) TaxID=1314807 RepID=A0A4S8M3X0_DENBC|nr:FAD/NAD-P-binding domain-containing protein [Dendrothele bispora CBS 962.96]
MSDNSAKDIASKWLKDFGSFLWTVDTEGLASSFHSDGWLRDTLVFTWNNRARCGPEKIVQYIRDSNLKPETISQFELDERAYFAPEHGPLMRGASGVSFGFKFTTPIAFGRGYARLLLDESSNVWKALTVFMTVDDLIGHEEAGPELGVYDGHTVAWSDVHEERRRRIETDPYVLIVGGGQTGLNVASRFLRMNIPCLVVEQNPRIGDNWRKRYPTLSLHTPRSHHPMLYQPFPDHWPIYTPRDKIANWLEQYAVCQDLIIWNNSHPIPTPSYDYSAKKWTITVNRSGEHVTLHPRHVVLATGTLGHPRIPRIVNIEQFKGPITHSSEYAGANALLSKSAGKRVVVVGAGNTSADICQDLCFHGAEVTMVQRSSTCVVSASGVRKGLEMRYPPDVPTAVSDFKFFSMPLPYIKRLLSKEKDRLAANEKDLQDGLRKAGMDINMGPDGTGNFLLVFEKLGGYWLDVGCADMIASGKIKIKQGVEIESATSDTVTFADGSTLPADALVLATGYESIRDTMREIFGDETMDKTSLVWGLDEEGELLGSYRPTGHPGLWFATGDFVNSRFSSKQLALEIKAIELGLMQV